MSELNITKGEWKKAAGKHYCAIRTGSMEDGTGKVIADMRIVGGYDYNPYDAHLLAASPDLYEALEWAMRFVDQVRIENSLPKGSGEDIAYDKAVKSLAKARGEQP